MHTEFVKFKEKALAPSKIKTIEQAINLLEAHKSNPSASLRHDLSFVAKSLQNENKEMHNALNKYGKVVDKKFANDIELLKNYQDPFPERKSEINNAVALHFIRNGQFDVAEAFMQEADVDLPIDTLQQFKSLHVIMSSILIDHDVSYALEWTTEHAQQLSERNSNLIFELHKLKYIQLFLASDDATVPLQYAREYLISSNKVNDVQKLIAALAYKDDLINSPYKHIFEDNTIWENCALNFTKQFSLLLGFTTSESPLTIALEIGSIALPTLLKMLGLVKEKRAEWTTQTELAVEIPLPDKYHYHSIFACPISKEQATDENPAMMLECGHVICQESLKRLSKGNMERKIKCPYCPASIAPKEAKEIMFI